MELLPSFDHPQNQAACIVSGTGLTHKNSALNRQMMHQATNKTHRQHANVPVGA